MEENLYEEKRKRCGGTLAMPQLIFFALVALVAYLGYRAFVREAERVTRRMERVRREAATRAMGTLVKDPRTGEYRLAKD